MSKQNVFHAAIELLKDALILVLACSALWMLAVGLGQPGPLSREEASAVTGPQNAQEGTESVRPMSIVATLEEGEHPLRRVLRYDDGAMEEQFQQVAGLLMEAMSSTDTLERVTRREWESALARAPGLCFDFQGEIPLSVLAGSLNVKQQTPDGVTRRLLLTVWKERVALYYYEQGSGDYYRCTTQVVSAMQLESALEGMNPNGAYYAFESELTDNMDPYTLLTPAVAPMLCYTAANPAAGGRKSLEELMVSMNFNLSGCVFYPAAGEEVARLGSDTLRLSTSGVLEYHADEGGAQQFPVSDIPGKNGVVAAVESCRSLIGRVTAGRLGQGRLYLTRVSSAGGGWDVEFEYCLNGVTVSLDGGSAAVFSVRDGYITGFTLRLRSYTQGTQEQLILPPVQAAAAVDALSLEGRELQLMYRDRGEEAVVPNWMAAAHQAG